MAAGQDRHGLRAASQPQAAPSLLQQDVQLFAAAFSSFAFPSFL
jgi:hypothetical protein